MQARAIFLFLCMSFYSSIILAEKGFYLNADVGLSRSNYTNAYLSAGFEASKIKTTGIAPKFAVGYAFNRVTALEFGVIYLQRPRFYGLSAYKPNQVNNVKQNVVHLVFRLSAPVGQFDLYAKGGVGYVVRADVQVWNGSEYIQTLKPGQFVRPVYGLGMDYRISQHWGLDLTWMQASGSSYDQLPASNFYGFGAFYQF